MSVFVSIASYCDPVLGFTLARAVERARWPARLHFGIVDQSPPAAATIDPGAVAPARATIVRIDPVDARGPCWARAIAMAAYDGEDWFLQLDSHMDFDLHWDERLVAQANELAPGRSGFVITGYPNAFVFADGQPVAKGATRHVLVHVVKPGARFDTGHPVLPFEAHPVDAGRPLAGFHVAAGCLFAPGRIVGKLPYDPGYYFHGEEQAYAARLFTHGWDIFHMPGLPVYHLYNTPGSGGPPRPLHWDAQHDRERRRTWWDLELRSRARLAALLAGEDLGLFSLGRERTLADYAAFSGIDYRARTLGSRAYDARAAFDHA